MHDSSAVCQITFRVDIFLVMGNTTTFPDTADEDLVRLGDRFVSPAAAQLHIFGVLLGAHVGALGHVPDNDLATLPDVVLAPVGELVENGIWRRDATGYRIHPDHLLRTMRESLDRLNDPDRCVATGSAHVRSENGECSSCGASPV